MREDEMEALLKIDGAGLFVNKAYAGYEARIHIPSDLTTSDKYDKNYPHAYAFSSTGVDRQEAIAKVWQEYQNFMTTNNGKAALHALQNLQGGHGQLMFRI